MSEVFLFLAQQPVLLLFVVIGVGSLVGHVKVRGVGLGAAAVLFLAIALSAWAASYGIDLEITEALGTLGLTLFTFCVGLVSGATFFSSLRRSLAPILAVAGVLLVSALVAVGAGRLLGLDAPVVAGAWAGAVTNTPALAAARDAAGDATAPTIGYAVTYLFGVVGMLVAVSAALRHRDSDTDAPPTLVTRTVRVEAADTPSIRHLEERHGDRIKFSRVRHGEESPIRTADDTDLLVLDDLVTVVGPSEDVEAVTRELGHTSSHRLEADRMYLDMRRVTVSAERAAGHTIAELDLLHRFGATISRVRRGDVDVVATDDFQLQLGDRVRVIAPRERMAEVSTWFGDSSRGLSNITPILLGLGMTAGILLGAVAFPVPGRVFSIGSAAGTLVVGLVLGRLGRIGPIVTAMPYTAAQAIAELGLLIFLAQAGTRAGAQIGAAFTSGAWLRILVLGVLVTTVVAVGLYVVMRRVFRIGGTRLSGIIGGTQTQPAVLAFANGRTGYDARVALGYALVYPAAMITKIVLGQVLGGL
ncbi:aspartate:alanine exchanger family transporter [Cellulomonas wangsupingiae]|uniref:Transporter n=1 Tax=Cellulomonas wangsupingiae TaxID=2968085 RepID=A0ABY5KC13_9CELL|nr:TrkA C-terminal domain-containing protein [Cellulomonas wangsupingiae]MCC2335235.1 transporter [Cellulomonas wangsupingiae]MCM0639145.1 transporter [Cellulomonas wangsupingiae]UUI66625.1 transporter [Cellulomonas wangsupingiae]